MLASATDLPYADGCCDIATSFDVLVQTPRATAATSGRFAEMYRVLRPGGVAFVRGAAYEWMRSAHDEALHTQRRYTLGRMSQLARDAGFEVVRATYANTVLFPVAASSPPGPDAHRRGLGRLRCQADADQVCGGRTDC